MRYRMYPQYRESGLEWLGELPVEWEIGKFSREVSIAEGQVDPEAAPYAHLPLIAPNHVESGTGRLLGLESAAEQGAESGKYLCRRGDVVYSKIRPALAKATIAPEECLCSADMYPLRARGRLDSRYLLWLLLSEPFTAWSVLEADRVAMPKINRDTLNSLRLPLPTWCEQRAIADLLDDQTKKLDSLLTRKRALIEKLNEKRTALISRTVTQGLPPEVAHTAGLNPEPERKSSGIDWIGDVPEHWQSGNIRRFADMRTGHTPSRQVAEFWEDCHIPWFTLADVWQLRDGRRKYLGETTEKISELGIANSAAELLPAGTVVLSRTASVGFSGIMRAPMATSQDFWNWVCGPKLLPEYLLLLFRVMTQEFARLTMGSTHKTIYQADAAGFGISVPPIAEQRTIVEYVGRETDVLDRLVDRIEAAIARLQEYRAALITAAVTGKIDVRGATRVDAEDMDDAA